MRKYFLLGVLTYWYLQKNYQTYHFIRNTKTRYLMRMALILIAILILLVSVVLYYVGPILKALSFLPRQWNVFQFKNIGKILSIDSNWNTSFENIYVYKQNFLESPNSKVRLTLNVNCPSYNKLQHKRSVFELFLMIWMKSDIVGRRFINYFNFSLVNSRIWILLFVHQIFAKKYIFFTHIVSSQCATMHPL